MSTPLTDTEIDRMLTTIYDLVLPDDAHHPVATMGGPELVAAAWMILSANRNGAPIGPGQVDNAHRIIRRAQLLGMA